MCFHLWHRAPSTFRPIPDQCPVCGETRSAEAEAKAEGQPVGADQHAAPTAGPPATPPVHTAQQTDGNARSVQFLRDHAEAFISSTADVFSRVKERLERHGPASPAPALQGEHQMEVELLKWADTYIPADPKGRKLREVAAELTRLHRENAALLARATQAEKALLSKSMEAAHNKASALAAGNREAMAVQLCSHYKKVVEAAEKKAKSADANADMYAKAWRRELGPYMGRNHHHIDACVTGTQDMRRKAEGFDRGEVNTEILPAWRWAQLSAAWFVLPPDQGEVKS